MEWLAVLPLSANRLLFKGLLWESNSTGMYYMRARWYDPELGRFASEDPCGLADGTNLYTFAGNDAINGHDPSGCISFKTVFGGLKKFLRCRRSGGPHWAPLRLLSLRLWRLAGQ